MPRQAPILKPMHNSRQIQNLSNYLLADTIEAACVVCIKSGGGDGKMVT